METNRTINCYYDHAANNTCRTNQFCYVEWRLSNFDQLIARNSRDIDISEIKLEKAFNCYNGRPDRLIRDAVCEQTATSTSHIIRKCCSNVDYCNNELLLPNETHSKGQFLKIILANLAQDSNATESFGIVDQYSDLPFTVQVVIILMSLSILCFAALAISQYSGSRRSTPVERPRSDSLPSELPLSARYEYSVKRILNDLLIKIGIYSKGRSASLPEDASPNISESRFARQTAEEDTIETPTVNNYDTNSMASREPLINRLHRMTMNEKMQLFQDNPRIERSSQGPESSTLQITLGSGLSERGEETSSGSGKGQPYLSQRSVSHDIQLKKIIGRGFFGVVWRGEFKGQPVAVKIFRKEAEASWERETEVYQTSMLRHKNILGLVASDKRLDCPTAGFWLVTDYYPLGSLFDFLGFNTIALWDAIRMAYSIANGLSHLHVEISGTRAKPAIAHRDMKSKNILVKNDGTCCIADLGMAIRYSSNTGVVDVPTNTRMGTRRYLAPEVLDEKLNLLDFEAVKATDIYALGLVFWEILRRTCLVAFGQLHYKNDVQLEVSETVTSGSDLYRNNVPYGPWPQATWTNCDGPNGQPENSEELFQVRQVREDPPTGAPPTEAPPTEAPPTEAPPTEEPPTEAPPTEAPPTEAPPTEAPSFEAPLTEESSTEFSPGEVPSIEAQQTDDPPTEAPSTQAPPTQAPPTQAPPTQAPPTQAPPTETPQSQKSREPRRAGAQAAEQPQSEAMQREMLEMPVETLDGLNKLSYEVDMFRVPFFGDVSMDPSSAEMREAVCVRKIRPRLSPRWLRFASMRDFAQLMMECWYDKPQARLSALRVRKSLNDIAIKHFKLNLMDFD